MIEVPSAPCLLSFVAAVFSGINSILITWLAHRRKRADFERHVFYSQMREKHGLDHPRWRQSGLRDGGRKL